MNQSLRDSQCDGWGQKVGQNHRLVGCTTGPRHNARGSEGVPTLQQKQHSEHFPSLASLIPVYFPSIGSSSERARTNRGDADPLKAPIHL